MENKSSKEYVAELLKQLEELKRKKAQKERKLQKLKISSHVDQQKDQTLKTSHASFNKVSDQLFCIENSSSLADFDKSDNNLHKKENNVSDCTKSVCVDVEKDKENCSYDSVDSSHVDQQKLKKNIMKTSELESPKCNGSFFCDRESSAETVNSNVHMLEKHISGNETWDGFAAPTFRKSIILDAKKDKENFFNVKHDSSFKENNSIEKSCLEIGEPKFYESVNDVKELKSNIETNRRIELSVDSKVISSTTNGIVKDITLDNSLCDGPKKDNSSSKSSSDTKDKSSDILDDSLNSNMSCFLSSELFPANDGKQEIILEDESSVLCVLEKTKQIETFEPIASDPKISLSVVPDTVSLENQQNNVSEFNFPKFSTPTDGINFLSSSDENVLNSQNKSVEQNAQSISNVKTVFSTTDSVCSMNKVGKDDIKPEYKFDPTKISLIIGKGLSSVLDAHYKSPKKPMTLKNKISSNINHEKINAVTGETALKKRKLFSDKITVACLEQHLKLDSKITSCESDKELVIDDIDFDNTDAFSSLSGSPRGLNISAKVFSHTNNSSDDIPTQVTKTINVLVNKVCEHSASGKCLFNDEIDVNMNDPGDKNTKTDSEILVVPETEGLGLYFSKDTEDFLETSTLSETLKDFHVKDNLLNVSSQSRLESPVVNKIVAAIKSTRDSSVLNTEGDVNFENLKDNDLTDKVLDRVEEKKSVFSLDNSLGMDTSFLEDDTQELGNYKQVPYMNETNIQDTITSNGCKTESNLNFICSLYGASNEAVIDVEIIVFGNIKYAFIQHKTQLHVWRQDKKKEWIKIFNHQIEDMLSLVKICVTRDDDNLVIVMLLSNDEQYCLQFLLFEKDVKIIKLMENTHWLEERHSKDSVLLCGLEGLMFATAQVKGGHEVSLHAFIGLKDSPRLLTAVLGSTDTTLCSLCKINNLPNALLGINDSMLYVWHILEARLVTTVSLHPHDYLPIKQCFWATVENGLIYLLTTCEGAVKHRMCQLLAANLATGFCQCAMTYSSQPSRSETAEIVKAVYMEPFLVLSHSNGALMWSVTDEHCCAALSTKPGTTSVAISRDFENWGLVVVGSRQGYVSCYGLN